MPKNFVQLPNFRPVSTLPTALNFISTDANGFSDLFYLGGSSIVAIFIPGSTSGAAWITANLAVYVSLANGTQSLAASYAPLFQPDGTQYIINIPASIPATGLFVQVDPYDFVGLDAVQFQSVNTGDAATPVVQTHSPNMTLITIGNGTF